MSNKPITVSLIGQRFGLLLVKKEVAPLIQNTVLRKRMRRVFECQCDCGNICKVQFDHLRQGKTKSCGCLFSASCKEKIKKLHKLNIKHGLCDTRVYRIWLGVNRRCSQKSGKNFLMYGKRGIYVCDRWKEFKNFLEDMGHPVLDQSIDRINNDGPYCKENCRWASHEVQACNKRNSHFLEHKGEKMNISRWAKKLNIHPHTLHERIRKGWTTEQAIETPVLRRSKIK